MYAKVIFSLLVILPCLKSQKNDFIFPDDSVNYASGNSPQSIELNAVRGTPAYETYVDGIISHGITKLTLAINKALLKRRDDAYENVVFAPMSITAALALILLGSNGKTYEELSSVMGFAAGVDLRQHPDRVHEQLGRMIRKIKSAAGFEFEQQVSFAAAIFVQNDYPIRTLYKQTAEQIYESEILNVDFKSNAVRTQQTINAWVSDRTKGKITSILGEPPSGANKVIIASAMYFKASWEISFIDGATTRNKFYPNGRNSGNHVYVDLMANGGFFPHYSDTQLQCDILGLPYKGNATVMYVVVPFDSDAKKLKEFENSLTQRDLDRLADSTVYQEVIFVFPKMRIESTINLKQPLSDLGINSLFNPMQANLALLSPGNSQPTQVLSENLSKAQKNPLNANLDGDSVLIFSRTGEVVNCTHIFDSKNNLSTCTEVIEKQNGTQKVVYKKFGDKIGRKIIKRSPETIDQLRQIINSESSDNDYQNPHLYADQILHKVFMDITESGTEAAATTSVTLARDGLKKNIRVDVPFFFFIRHEETKTILFWGSVREPTPSYPTK